MSTRSATEQRPWSGGLIFAGALVFAALALAQISDPSQLLKTWYLTRASGLIAFFFLWASVVMGLLQSTGIMKGLSTPLANIDLHEHLSLWSVFATVFHAVILVWDHYSPFRWSELVVPFSSAFKPVWTGLGTVAFYTALLAVVSTYLRPWLSTRAWRTLHLSSLLGFLLALVHGVMEGTDSGLAPVAFMYRFALISLLALLGLRVVKGVFSRAGASGRG